MVDERERKREELKTRILNRHSAIKERYSRMKKLVQKLKILRYLEENQEIEEGGGHMRISNFTLFFKDLFIKEFSFNILFKYMALLLVLIFMILYIQINRYVVIAPASMTMPSIIVDRLRFKAYRVYTSEDSEGKIRIMGFCEMTMPR